MDSSFLDDVNLVDAKLEQSHESMTDVTKQIIPLSWIAQFELSAKHLIDAAHSNNLPAVVVAVAGLERTLYHLGGLSNQEMVNQVQDNINSNCFSENFSSGNYL